MAATKSKGAKPGKKKARAVKLAPATGVSWHASGLCAQAQADGVPCSEQGRKCEECDKAEITFLR